MCPKTDQRLENVKVKGVNSDLKLSYDDMSCRYRTNFLKWLAQGLLFKGILKGQESKSWVFFEGPRRFWGPQKQERKNDQNSIIFWEKNKLRRNFIWEKLMEFLLFNENLKNLIFFPFTYQKNGIITLILSKF